MIALHVWSGPLESHSTRDGPALTAGACHGPLQASHLGHSPRAVQKEEEAGILRLRMSNFVSSMRSWTRPVTKSPVIGRREERAEAGATLTTQTCS